MTIKAKIPNTDLYLQAQHKNNSWNIYTYKEGRAKNKTAVFKKTNTETLIKVIKFLISPMVFKNKIKTKKSLINLITKHNE